MNMLKRSLAMMLVLCMLIGYVPFNAFASEDGTETPVAPVAETEEVVETTVATVPPTTEETVPPTTEETVPPTTVETVPETTEETVPETTKETYPQLTMGSLTFVVPEVATTVTTASTEGVYTGTAPAISEFLRVFHLDVGRKYFTVDQVKAVLDLLSANGYTHMELAIGNDGLRFLLDDMSVLSYDGATVANGIKAGNAAYAHSGEWSQSEMDSIIAYADKKNIEIIPLINTPGHMDAILAAMNACDISGAYSGSARTVDLTNETAVEFTKALLGKYMAYFASKGCKYFNIGADEYANDISTGGWANLISNNQYYLFIEYVNELVQMAAGYSMRPIAFNDGIYYNSTTTHGTFDTRLIVASWTSGWYGFNVASTSFLSGKGHQILNTNERWYYVLGNHTSGDYPYSNAISYAETESVLTVTDRDSSVTPVGAMQCVWCDTPSVSYDDAEVTRISNLITTLSANNTDYFVKAEEPEVTEPIPVVDETTKVSVKAEGVTGLTVTVAEAPVIEGAAEGKVLAWDMTPVTADGNYIGEAKVAVPVPDGWDVNRMGAFVVEADGVKLIEGAPNAEGKFEFTMPHFSVGGTYEAEPAAETTVTVNLTVGQTSETYTDNTGYYTTADGLDTKVATVKLGGTAGSESTVNYTSATVTCRNLLNSNATEQQATNYYVKADDGNYYPLYVTRTSQWNYGSTTYTYTYYYSTDNGETFEEIGTQSVTSTYRNANITVYTKSGTEAVPAQTTVSFTGVSVGETTAKIGSTTYKIVVSKGEITADLILNASTTYPDSSTNITVDDDTVVSATSEDGKLKITGLKEGTATVTTDNAVYTINVKKENLDDVTPLSIEYWITNVRAYSQTSDFTEDTLTIKATDTGINSAVGVAIADLADKYASSSITDGEANRLQEYWQARILDITKVNDSTSGKEHQSKQAGDDETMNGAAFTRVRYWNGAWQVYTNDWVTVDRTTASATWVQDEKTQTYTGEKNQLVVYYMEMLQIADELAIRAADWGKVGNGSEANDYLPTDAYCSISIQLVYEDNTTNPTATTAEALRDKTIVFGYWDGGRGIGTYNFKQLKDYEIYRVTAETGSVTASFGNGAWGSVTVTDLTWDDNAMTVWEDDPSSFVSIANNANNFQETGIYENLHWDENKEAILLRVYIRAVASEDALTVHYVDADFDAEFYHYNIPVKEGVTFNEGFAMDTTAENALINNSVVNYYGSTQNVNADLTTMAEIGAQYRYSNFKLVRVEFGKNADGTTDYKNVYLYYTFTPVSYFVADFGLPIDIKPSDLDSALTDAIVSSIELSDTRTPYGNLTVNGKTLTYTPSKVLEGVDGFTMLIRTTSSVEIEGAGDNQVAFRVYIVPATSVYYEAGFLKNYVGTWTQQGATSAAKQTTEKLYSKQYAFGYLPGYNTNGQDAVTSTIGAEASFEFTGNGFEVFVNSATSSGYLIAELKNSAGAVQKVYMVNTVAASGDTDATTGQNTNLKALPAVRIIDTDLAHGEYTVTLKKLMDSKPVNIDGFRVFNTLEDSTVFTNDLEDNPEFYELRDMVLNAIGVNNDTSEDYGTLDQMIDQVYNDVAGSVAIITSENVSYGSSSTIQDLLDNGPKNELFLRAGQTLTFKVKTAQKMQLGMKAPTGTTSYKVSCTNTNGISGTIETPIDMFYDLGNARGNEVTYTVSVENTGSNILSVTLLKICDDPSFAFQALTKGDVEGILQNAGYTNSGSGETTEPETPVVPELPIIPENPVEPEVPEEPEVVYADAKLTVNLVDYRGKKQASASITMNGEEGTDAVFSAEAILEAAEAKMPKKYGFVNESAVKDVTVTYGDDATVTVKVGKVATLKVTYINLFGRVKGTATLTKVQNGNGNARFTAAEIKAAVPEGYRVLVGTNVPVSYGSTKSALVTVW